MGKPTAVIRQPYEGKVISVWTTDWEHERPYESPAVCLQLPKPNQLNAVCLSTWNCLNTFLLDTHTLFSHLHQIKKWWCWSLGQLRTNTYVNVLLADRTFVIFDQLWQVSRSALLSTQVSRAHCAAANDMCSNIHYTIRWFTVWYEDGAYAWFHG